MEHRIKKTAHGAWPIDPLHPIPPLPEGQSSSAQLSTLERRKRPLASFALLFVALVALSLVAVEAWSRINARQTQLDVAAVATVNIARATAEHAENSLNLADAAVWGLVETAERDGLSSVGRVQRSLQARVARTPPLFNLFIDDEAGNRLVDSRQPSAPMANDKQHDYLQWHRVHADREVHLGSPRLSDGLWLLPLSRRIEHSDGKFAGVAVANVRLDFFQSFYAEFNIGKDGVFLLALDHGQLVTRRPHKPELVGSDISQGPVFSLVREGGQGATAIRLGLQDQIERTYSFRRVKSYPLIVAAGLAHHEVLKEWQVSTVSEAAVIAVLLVILLGIGSKLFAQVKIRDRVEWELRNMQVALESSNGALRVMAMKDGLTGLSNRRELDEQMLAEFARGVRNGTSLAMVMIDVDFFKPYNDTYGHANGDRCLQAVSTAIAGTPLRTTDTSARFGGEEFAVLLPNTDLAGALAVAQSVCRAVSALQMPHAGSELGIVTVSAGIAAFVPTIALAPLDLIEKADCGLYLAKTSGRNQVCAA